MNDIGQTQALTSLNKLAIEFERAAMNERKHLHFHTWFGDAQEKHDLYVRYAQKTSAIMRLIADGDKQTAATELTNLKTNFDFNATAHKKASEGYLISWFNKDKTAEKTFQGYAQTVENVLKLF
jgi:hypothetical protein